MLTLAILPASASAAPGDLDSTFGQGKGFALTASGTTLGLIGRGLAIQSDGKIVVVGSNFDPGGDGGTQGIAARYLASGALDPTFGSGSGIVATTFSIADTLESVALQSDGRIVAAGQTTVHGTKDVLVVRLLGSGALDQAYGAGTGASAPDFGGAENAAAVAIERDGKIVVGGSGSEPGVGTGRLLAARSLVGDPTQAGFLDTSYGLGMGASRRTHSPAARPAAPSLFSRPTGRSWLPAIHASVRAPETSLWHGF